MNGQEPVCKYCGAKMDLDPVLELVNEQAEDEGLWFEARTVAEAYLQKELRRLHALIEARPRAPEPSSAKGHVHQYWCGSIFTGLPCNCKTPAESPKLKGDP